ncbi:MAG: ATP synthase F1 subunit delta [Bacteroidales bacterium]|nr:ATP synthase F1 subunit delta [Bacteroidales bacterium]
MDEKRLQKRYAQSLFDLAREQDIINSVSADIALIYGVCKENREFEVILRNPVIKPLKKKDILLALFKDNCNELTVKFLSLIVEKRREIHLRSICEEYFAICNAYDNVKVAALTVAEKTSDEVKEMIKHRLERDCSCKVQIDEKIDKNLIGGFIIEIDGKRYDASFLRKLNDLKRKLISE